MAFLSTSVVRSDIGQGGVKVKGSRAGRGDDGAALGWTCSWRWAGLCSSRSAGVVRTVRRLLPYGGRERKRQGAGGEFVQRPYDIGSHKFRPNLATTFPRTFCDTFRATFRSPSSIFARLVPYRHVCAAPPALGTLELS